MIPAHEYKRFMNISNPSITYTESVLLLEPNFKYLILCIYQNTSFIDTRPSKNTPYPSVYYFERQEAQSTRMAGM